MRFSLEGSSPSTPTMKVKYRNYSEDDIRNAVKSSYSLAETLENLI